MRDLNGDLEEGDSAKSRRYCVTAIQKGDHVYLSAPIEWPSLKSRIQSSPTPTYMSRSAADRLASRASQVASVAEPWDRLTDIQVLEEEGSR